MTNQPYQRPIIPNLHEYWDAPAQNDDGDNSADTIYRSVGEALSSWESVEIILARMFGLFVESESAAAERAYGVISSSSNRTNALVFAVKIFASKQGDKFPMQDFDLLIKHIGQAAPRRNEIAHGIVQSITIDNQKRGFFLTPAFYNSRKIEARTPSFWEKVEEQSSKDPFIVFGYDYRYTSKDIDYFTNLFNKLCEQATGLFIEQLMIVNQAKFERVPNNQKITIQLGAQPTAKD